MLAMGPWGHIGLPWGHIRLPWGHIWWPWGHGEPLDGPGAAFGAALVTALWRQGLDLTQCSMYEDISQRPQPTYQDVGTAGDSGAGLEKP